MARLQHRQTVDPVVQARRAFFESGRAPAGYVPPAILQSWRRCLGLGLAVNARPSIEPVDAPRLRALRERHEHLWRLPRTFPETVFTVNAESDNLSESVCCPKTLTLIMMAKIDIILFMI